jgi:hypothetical protein
MMRCMRCSGLLVKEHLFEANGMSSTERVDCERCLNCGAVEDAIIRANRHATGIPVRSREPRSRSSHVPAFETLSREIVPTDIHSTVPGPQPYIYAARSGNHLYSRPMGNEGNE